jgi:thiol-disulfide isomerase/thioredoxin
LKKLIYIFTFICSISAYAENDSIIGYAPEFVGQKVTLYTYDDYLTMTKIQIGEGVVSYKDSVFRISNPVKSTVKAIIEINKTEAEFYLQPHSTYQLGYFKPKNTPIAFANQKVETLFYGLDSNDVNYRVLQYNQWFDQYIYYHKKDIAKYGIAPYIDTFKIYAYSAYKNVNNSYFINYVRYNIALIEQVKVTKQLKYSKINTYLEYIDPYPVYAKHDQYMTFINAFYPEDFEGYDVDIKTGVIMAINHASPSRLMKTLRKDPLLKKTELREMLMVKMLGKSYYKRGYDRKHIITMLDSISHFAKFKTNAIAAKNMKSYLTKIETGYPAPQFEIIQLTDTISLNKYNGKFVYINFFASWNQSSVNEMKIIKELKDKYGDYIAFVSFSTDKDSLKYQNFIKQHPDFDWDIIYLGEKHDIIKQYNVTAIPAYYLINQEGFIAMAPAKGPAPNGIYDSIESTFEYIASSLKQSQYRH